MSEEPSERPSRSLSPLDSATRTEKLLLHHFTTSASRITSCHASIQSSFCHLLLPMATSYPPLLSALMALSAIHRESLFTSASSPFHQTNEIISLKASSVSQLRSGLLMPTNQRETKDVLLATALMLTMCEIHSGADQPRSWRLHLEGAKAILSSSPTAASSNPNPNSQAGLLERWYTSIESLAAISSKGLRAGDLPDTSSLVLPNNTSALESDNDVFLDDYFGFCTDLVPAFREVGALAWERRSISDARMKGDQTLLSEEDLNTEALLLEFRIRDMILRDLITPPRFYSGVHSSLSPEVLREFYLCNETYQYAALLHIYRCVMCIDKEDERVQGAVTRILDCVEAIAPREGLSPYIVLTMPLFTAGREAVGDDRERVRRNMKELWERLRLRNVWRSLEILEAGWESGNGKLGKGRLHTLWLDW
jgi:hypothetical protein